jgi:hypothetical protein
MLAGESKEDRDTEYGNRSNHTISRWNPMSSQSTKKWDRPAVHPWIYLILKWTLSRRLYSDQLYTKLILIEEDLECICWLSIVFVNLYTVLLRINVSSF